MNALPPTKQFIFLVFPMENEKPMKKKKVGTRRVISYFWKMTMARKRPFVVASVGMIITSLTNLLLPIYYTKIIDIVQVNTVDRMSLMPQLMGILIAMAIVELFSVGGWRLVGFGSINLEPRVMRKIYEQCFAYIHRHSFSFFTNNFSGALVKKINKLA